MSTAELLTILLSIAGSLLSAWGGYKLFQGRTEEWRSQVKENFKRLEGRIESTHRRGRRHANRILTHELELDQVFRKLNLHRSYRRDDTESDDYADEDE